MAATRNAKATVVATIQAIPMFDETTESFSSWIREFNDYMAALQEPENSQLQLLRLRLPRHVKDVIDELNEDRVTDMSFNETCDMLTEKYDGSSLVATANSKWRNLKFSHNVDNLAKEMKLLYKQAWPDRHGEERRRDLLNKLCDIAPAPIQHTLDEYKGTLEEAIEKIKRLGLLSSSKSTTRRDVDQVIICHYCNKVGHKKDVCRKRQRDIREGKLASPTSVSSNVRTSGNSQPFAESNHQHYNLRPRTQNNVNNLTADIEYIADVANAFTLSNGSTILPSVSKKGNIHLNSVQREAPKRPPLPIVTVHVGTSPVKALIDSGANTNVISVDVVSALGHVMSSSSTRIRTTFGAISNTLGKVTMCLTIKDRQINADLDVVAGSQLDKSYKIILGTPTLHILGPVTFDIPQQTISFDDTVLTFEKHDISKILNNFVVEAADHPIDVTSEIIKRFPEYPKMCALNKTDIGLCKIPVPRQSFLSQIPHVFRKFPWSPSLKPLATNLINELKQSGVIRPSSTQFLHNLICVKKPDGNGYRATLDLRKTNANTVPARYPCSNIRNLLDNLHSYKYFSKIDLVSCYHQFKLDERDCHRFGLYTEDEGIFEFTRLPQGFINSASIVAEIMDKITAPYKNIVRFYADDGLVTSSSDDPMQHIDDIATTLKVLYDHGLKISGDKCCFLSRSLKFLGHRVSTNGLEIDSTSIEAISKISVPQNVRQLRSFIGCIGFFQSFVIGYATLLQPLYKLLHKNTPFVFGDEQVKAFNEAKNRLSHAPSLGHFDETLPVHVYTDASQVGYGAAMIQWKKQLGNESPTPIPIMFWSKCRPHSIKTRSSTHLELHCITLFFRSQRIRLIGRPIYLHCDNRPVIKLLSSESHNESTPLLESWIYELSEYNIIPNYCPGPLNHVADLLSRSHPTSEEVSQINVLQAKNLVGEYNIRDIQSKCDTTGLDLETKHGIIGKYIKHNDDSVFVPYLPLNEYKQTAMKVHQCGHFGKNKLTAILKLRWFNENAKDIIKEITSTCSTCQYRNISYAKKPAPSTIAYTLPRLCYSADLCGPFNPALSSNNSYRYIVGLVDCFSRFIMAQPVEASTTREVTEAVTSLVVRHGKPLGIQTDNATCFGDDFTEFCSALGIEHKKGTPYLHESSSLIERSFRTLESCISKLLSDTTIPPNYKFWDKLLDYCTFFINTSPSDSLDTSPFHLFYGTPPNLIIDFKYVHPGNYDSDTCVADLLYKTQLAHSIAFNKLINKRLDSHPHHLPHTQEEFAKGDLILVRDHIPSNKLAPVYKGPFVVTSSDHNRVFYQKKGSKGRPRVASKQTIKKFHEGVTDSTKEE
uniref:RNA-directed DNA polymerase n=1 Tax=Strongyloides papillosus TaxID=174720 RepID=A0A0N5B7Y8_STREA